MTPTTPIAAVPAQTDVLTGDELRKIARSARTSASDPASPEELVLAGWRAALAAQGAAERAVPAAAVERIVHLRASREKRIYVAGPMTGLPDFNFPAFNAAAAALRADGWHVENPAEHGHVEGAGWADYLRYDLSRVATCGAVYLLPGWSKSKGAQLEVHVAGVLGLQLILADGAEPVQADSGVQEDAGLLRYALADGGNQRMNWQDVYDGWNGEGYFRDALMVAMTEDAALAAKGQKP
ncbi:DUF4406 domain-containing protein [Acidovorax sp. LjRoot117]|uniref:DUF4406 domain-containing protein n=1 Tax=Acidovorax sp. LjRoot117 TaxID=3342255 RepID=UPI003ED0C50C